MPELQAGLLGGRLLGSCCGRLLLVRLSSRPVRKAYLTQLRAERRGQVSPPLCSCPLLPLSLQAGRVVGGGRRGEVAEAGPTETLDPMPGVPQEEVAGGGVGLGTAPTPH